MILQAKLFTLCQICAVGLESNFHVLCILFKLLFSILFKLFYRIIYEYIKHKLF